MAPWPTRSRRASLVLVMSMIVALLPVAAQATDSPTPRHPAIGAWVLYLGGISSSDDPASGLTIHADGTVRDDGGVHGPGIGAWAATDERGADVTIRYPGTFDGVIGALIVRARVTVHPMGDKIFGEYTVQTPRGDGADVERGPGDLMGFRSDVEPMGADPVTPGAEATLEAGRAFTMKATTPFPTSMAFAFESVADGTRVDLTVEAEPTGLYKLAGPLLVSGARWQLHGID